jgi:pyrroline-5-carboxylate reductase
MPQASGIPPVLLVGAGRMGGAMFTGWRTRNLAPSVLLDPAAPPGLARQADLAVADPGLIPPGFAPAAIILAIKPQLAATVLPTLAACIPPGAVILSILAGTPIASLEKRLGTPNPIVRAMPNTPAAIGQGITAAFAGPAVTPAQRSLCDTLLQAIGDVVWLEAESLIDPVTAVSGSGPAYVFLLAELLEQAATERGLPPATARLLARKTVSGAGALLAAATEDAADLRRNVTSPKGTTEAALAVLMAPDAWPATLRKAVIAAEDRANEIGKEGLLF